jgi:hypothetical protein
MDDPARNGGNGSNRGERLQIMLNPAELEALDNFRFKLRMPSRAAAVRELLKRGLAAAGFATSPQGAKSTDYGVLAPAEARPKRPNGAERKAASR